MRFNTNFKLFSIFLSLSVAAPIAQYSEVVFAGSPIDNGIDSSSNNFLTGSYSPVMGSDLMAARRQRDKTRRRPSTQPQSQLRPSIPHQDICPVDSTGPSCQPDEKPATIPAAEQADIPDPWFDEPGEVEGTAGAALGFWGLWNLLNNPSPALSP